MRDAFEAAKGQLDFVSVTPHAMWPDIPGANDPRLKWVIDYHTGAFKRLREGGYEKYVKMSNEYNNSLPSSDTRPTAWSTATTWR